jgi:hypothetical protein
MRTIMRCRTLLLGLASVVAAISGTLWLPSCSPVPAIQIAHFEITPSVIEKGDSAQLRWEVTGADKILLNNGIGEVPATGTKQIKADSSTLYILTATNSGHIVTENTTLAVRDFEISRMTTYPPDLVAGKEIRVEVNVKNNCALPQNYTAALAMDGNPTQSADFVIDGSGTHQFVFTLSGVTPGQHKLICSNKSLDIKVVTQRQLDESRPPDSSYIKVDHDVGYYVGTSGRSCLFIISVHNNHEKWALADVKLVLPNAGLQFDIAPLIEPMDSATIDKPSLPCANWTITYRWVPPGSW